MCIAHSPSSTDRHLPVPDARPSVPISSTSVGRNSVWKGTTHGRIHCHKLAPSSHNSPSSELAGLIDLRRILTPGHVSSIDHEGSQAEAAEEAPRDPTSFVAVWEEEEEAKGLDRRLCLSGRGGKHAVMELDSAVLCQSSASSLAWC
jgi:hypothetical protein